MLGSTKKTSNPSVHPASSNPEAACHAFGLLADTTARARAPRMTSALRLLSTLAIASVAVACTASTGESVDDSHERLDTATQCDNLIGEMAFYDLALQSELARGCLNPGRVEEFSLSIIDVGQVASRVCTTAYGINDSWFANFSNHVKNAWRSQTDCIQKDAIAARCPLTTQHVTVDLDDVVCTSDHSLTVYLRKCTDPADVPICQAYFGSRSIVVERGFCSKDYTLELSECDVQPVVAPAPLPTPGAGGGGTANVGSGGASSAIDGITGKHQVGRRQ